MDNQRELLVIRPDIKEGDTFRPLLQLIEWLADDIVLPPDFQREYVWPDRKLKDWVETVMNQQAVGCFVTYQQKGKGPYYLADGFQRLTATSRFVKNPLAYGFHYGVEQAKAYCSAFAVTLQHRHYKDHFEAMRAFQRLNLGTALTPAEFHRGELSLTEIGKRAYELIPGILERCETSLLTTRKPPRNQKSTLLRDSFALFTQYILKYKGMEFWGVSKNQVDPDFNTVEKVLSEYLNDSLYSLEKLEKELSDFERFLSGQIAELLELAKETGQEKKPFSPTFLRWTLHLAIWRKNNGKPVAFFQDLVRELMIVLSNYQTFTSRFELPHPDGGVCVRSLQVGRLMDLKLICEGLGVPLHEGKTRIRKPTRRGYDVSHKKPFSQFGEGETVIESSPRNRARGAKPISSPSLFYKSLKDGTD